MSSKQRVALHRARKIAKDFREMYLNDKDVCPYYEFIEAKQREFCLKHGISSVLFHQKQLDAFMDRVSSECNMVENKGFAVIDCISAWDYVKNKEVK